MIPISEIHEKKKERISGVSAVCVIHVRDMSDRINKCAVREVSQKPLINKSRRPDIEAVAV